MATTGWGDEEWQDDDQVRVLYGESIEPWRTWDACCGSWRFPPGLMSFLRDGAGFRCPTPIQANTWPVLVCGRDVVGISKTGSGKTLGYLLPGYIKVKRAEMDGLVVDYNSGPAMLVLAPTRELCQQIYEESDRFGRPAHISTACVFGGAPKNPQVSKLRCGPHCVCATPGRLADFLREQSIRINGVLYLVLDEADRMLDMGFEPQVAEIGRYLPEVRQTALFTATWPREVRQIAASLTKNATHIQVGSTDTATTNADIRQHIRKVRSEVDKMKFLQDEIFPYLAESGHSALVFVRTKRTAADIYAQLARAGAPIACIHGDLSQSERDQSLYAFKTGKAKVLVATDICQRGLDIKNCQVVVNYDPPGSMEDYIHRIGRTGRAGEQGDAYTCLTDMQRREASDIAKAMRKAGQAVPEELREMCSSFGGGGGLWGGGGASSHGGGYSDFKFGANLDAGWGRFVSNTSGNADDDGSFGGKSYAGPKGGFDGKGGRPPYESDPSYSCGKGGY